jgi:twinkle protein
MKLIHDDIDLSQYLSEPEPGERVIAASSLFDQVRDHFLLPPEASGARMPWPKSEGLVRFRKGEVSLWPGINGSGKSMLTTQVAKSLCEQDERVCIGSFEMKPVKTMARMTRQAAGNPDPSVPFMRQFHDWTDGRLWLFDHHGQIAADRVIAVIRYCADKLSITHFVVDSLMRCVRGEDDYNGQKDFVGALCSVAMDTGMHVHLVHHVKKLADDSQKPGKFDAKGSGAITDQVDNVFTVWRNKPKERALAEGRFENDSARLEVEGRPDALVICDKQRNGEWEGRLSLWYDPRSMSYRGDPRLPFSSGMTFPREPGEDE